jgi:hypothetical protein
LSVRRASRASSASYCSLYQPISKLNRARQSYFARARPCSSCEQQSRTRGKS